MNRQPDKPRKVFPEHHLDWRKRWEEGAARMALEDTSRRVQLAYPADRRKRGMND